MSKLNALDWAVKNNQLEVVKALLKENNFTYDTSILIRAVRRYSDIEMVKVLVEHFKGIKALDFLEITFYTPELNTEVKQFLKENLIEESTGDINE